MSNNPPLTTLIEQLRQLRIQSATIRQQEEDIIEQIQQRASHEAATRSVVLSEEIVIAERVRSPRDLRVGDRVRITNSVDRITRGREPTEEDRLAIVTEIREISRRVIIRTDSNIVTWRYSKNLTHLSQ
jgi:hypothetical protein